MPPRNTLHPPMPQQQRSAKMSDHLAQRGYRHYNSHPGFDPEAGTAVVILSNLSPSDRIPATVPGIKLLQELRQ